MVQLRIMTDDRALGEDVLERLVAVLGAGTTLRASEPTRLGHRGGGLRAVLDLQPGPASPTAPAPARPTVREVAGARVPEEVAVRMARQLYAPLLHLGEFRRLLNSAWVTEQPPGRGADSTGPVGEAHGAVGDGLLDLLDWAGRTAQVSGAVEVEPAAYAQQHWTRPGEAWRALYGSDTGRSWCWKAGGAMLQSDHRAERADSADAN